MDCRHPLRGVLRTYRADFGVGDHNLATVALVVTETDNAVDADAIGVPVSSLPRQAIVYRQVAGIISLTRGPAAEHSPRG